MRACLAPILWEQLPCLVESCNWSIDENFLQSLLSPTWISVPPCDNQRIASYFDQLPATTQVSILNALVANYENIHPQVRLRFLQLILPRHPSVQELVQWMLDQCQWNSASSFHDAWQYIHHDDGSLLGSFLTSFSPIIEHPSKTRDESHKSATCQESLGPSTQLPTNKRKRRDYDPWYAIIKSVKTNSVTCSEKVVQVLRKTPLEQLISYWKDWLGRGVVDRGDIYGMDDGALLCIIGNEILVENKYSAAHLVAVVTCLFLPFVVHLRYGASRQVMSLFMEWAKKWPLVMQQYFILPLLRKSSTLEAPQIEVIGKVTQNTFSSALIQDTMKLWLTQSIQPWNESILVLLEQWLFQVNDDDIICLLLGQLEANAPFVELSPKWIKLLYDLCQQHLPICLEYRHVLRRCLTTTCSYLTEKCLALLTSSH